MRLILFLLLFTPLSLLSQNISTSLNSNKFELSTDAAISKLKPVTNTLLQSQFTSGYHIGVSYSYNLLKWYTIKAGISIGTQNYEVHPNKPELSLCSSTGRIMNVSIPVTINRYFPFNNRFALYFSTGIVLLKRHTSLAGLGGISIEEERLYQTQLSIFSPPQPGVLFEFGGVLNSKKNNFFSYGIIAKKFIGEGIVVHYNYYEPGIKLPKTGSLESTNFYIGIQLAYCFKLFKND